MKRAALVAFALAAGCNDTFRFDETSDAGSFADAAPDAAVPPPCQKDADCSAVPGLRCDVASGLCVACLGDGDCAAPSKRCDSAWRACVACLGDSDCATRQRCDSTTRTCLDTCFDFDDRCPLPGFVCEPTLGLCIECRTSVNCAGNPAGGRCDRDIGRCVACLSNAECPAERPRCDRRIGRCVGCVSSAECAPGTACAPASSTCEPLE